MEPVRKHLIFVCSYLCAGKSTVARTLATKHDATFIEVSDIVKKLLNVKEREKLQGHPELHSAIIDEIKQQTDLYDRIVVSGVRQVEILKAFPDATCIWITAPSNVRLTRYLRRTDQKDHTPTPLNFTLAEEGDIALGINQVKEYIFSL